MNRWLFLFLFVPLILSAGPWSGFNGKKIHSVDFHHYTGPEYIVKRELSLRADEFFHEDSLHSDMTRLKKLDIFSSIRPVIIESSEGEVVIHYYVRELLWIIAHPSYEISEQNGLALGISAKSVNFLKRDITLFSYYLTGGFDFYSIEVDWPWVTGDHFSLYFLGRKIIRDNLIDNFKERLREFCFRSGYYLSDHWRFYTQGDMLEVKSDGVLDDQSAINRLPGGEYRNITLNRERDRLWGGGLGLIYDTRDSFEYPYSGTFLEYFIKTAANDGRFSSKGFVENVFDFRFYYPLKEKQTLFFSMLAQFRSGERGREIPYFIDYHVGGANTVRGYSVDDEEQMAGKHELLLSGEYRFELIGSKPISVWFVHYRLGLGMSLFADFGTVSDYWKDLGGKEWRCGGGLGLNFLLPSVGVTRLEAAFNKEGGWSYTLFLSFPKEIAQRKRIR